MNFSTSTAEPPEHITGDYVQIAYLTFVLIVGTPTNIFILIKLFRERRQAQGNSIKVSNIGAIIAAQPPSASQFWKLLQLTFFYCIFLKKFIPKWSDLATYPSNGRGMGVSGRCPLMAAIIRRYYTLLYLSSLPLQKQSYLLQLSSLKISLPLREIML